MLRAIHIKRFGLFTDASFGLGPVTVFSGVNQSGKSTLFDAIRIEAFAPDRRRAANRALYARYGDDADVRLDWAGERPEMSDDEFMNLFAVSAGNLAVDLDGDWLNSVKKNLFAGGIDPRNLIEAFARLSSEKGTLKHMRDRAELQKQRADAEARLEALQAQRAEILAALDAQQSARDQLKGLTATLGAHKGEVEQATAELAWQERIVERQRWQRALELLDEVQRLEARQSDRVHLSVDRTAELDALEQARQAAQAEQIRAESAAQAAQQALETLTAEEAALARELEARRHWTRAMEALDARLAAFRDGRFTQQLLRGFLAAFLVVAGVGAVVASDRAAWGWGVLGGCAGGVALLFTLLPWWEGRRLLRELKDRWRNLAPGTEHLGRAEQLLASQTLDGVAGGLAQVGAELERLGEEHRTRAAALGTRREEAATAAQALEVAERALQGAAGAVRDWLAGMGVDDRDAYRDQVADYRRVHNRLDEVYGRLEQVRSEREALDDLQLRRAAEAALAAADADAVPEQGLPEPQLRALRERVEGLQAEQERLEADWHALDRTSHGDSERLVGQLGTLPDEIAHLNDTMRKIDAAVTAIDDDRRAAARALELFEEVAQDESTVLAELSGSVAGVFERVSGVREAWSRSGILAARDNAVALAGLREADIEVLDRGGAVRPVEHLSSGAKQLLYLALRLEMARRDRQGRFALLCLDEPFAFLDPERQVETLQYLREFREETGWQLVLFTNEPEQVQRVQAVFPDCQVHRLP